MGSVTPTIVVDNAIVVDGFEAHDVAR